MRRKDGTEAQFHWGDKVEVLDRSDAGIHVAVHGARGIIARGLVSAQARLRDDGLILGTPGGKVMFTTAGGRGRYRASSHSFG